MMICDQACERMGRCLGVDHSKNVEPRSRTELSTVIKKLSRMRGFAYSSCRTFTSENQETRIDDDLNVSFCAQLKHNLDFHTIGRQNSELFVGITT